MFKTQNSQCSSVFFDDNKFREAVADWKAKHPDRYALMAFRMEQLYCQMTKSEQT